MQCFFVHVKCALGRTYEVAEAVALREIASEIYSISGEYDLLLKFYVEGDVDIGFFVNEHLHDVPGVERTVTTLTFRTF